MINPFLPPEPRAVFDVVAAHLDDAAFAYEVWEKALHSPLVTLSELARGPETRLFANLEGLVLGGDAVAERLLLPELASPEEPDRFRCVAAALALLGQRKTDAVYRTLQSPTAEAAFGARRAFEISPIAGIDAFIGERLGTSSDSSARPTLLAICAARGMNFDNLLAPLQSENADEVREALVLARRAPVDVHLSTVEYLLNHVDARVRDQALITALVFRSTRALEACVARACDVATADPLAITLLALFGSPRHHSVLIEHLDKPHHRHHALFALGFTGNYELVQTLVERLSSSDLREARLSSEAFAGITGLPTELKIYSKETPEPDDSLPPLEEDDLDADLVPPHEESLRLPNVAAVTSWWLGNRRQLASQGRLLAGQPWSAARVAECLESAPLRRRHALAMWLAIGTAGAVQVDTLALSARQRAQLAALSRLPVSSRASA